MLDDFARKSVDQTWNRIWSTGITNPILVSDLLGTLLIARTQSAEWNYLKSIAANGDATEVSQAMAEMRRRYQIEPGSELEEPTFWRSTIPLVEAMEALESSAPGLQDDDLLGDVYEHILARLSIAGHFGQFRTPRHIVDFMVDVMSPSSDDLVVDPACGTAGFLVAAHSYHREYGTRGKYLGVEIDRTMVRLARTNLVMHDIAGAEVFQGNGLLREVGADLILANPPYAGAVDHSVAASFECGAKRTELLFTESIMGQLVPGGRAAVIVPSGVLSGRGNAARWVRQRLVDENKLVAVIELPGGVFRPYTGVKTGILVWSKGGTTDRVTMVRVDNDGFSLDQRREPIAGSALPRALKVLRDGTMDKQLARSVSRAELATNGYDLTPSRYVGDMGVGEHPRNTLSSALLALERMLDGTDEIRGELKMMKERVSR